MKSYLRIFLSILICLSIILTSTAKVGIAQEEKMDRFTISLPIIISVLDPPPAKWSSSPPASSRWAATRITMVGIPVIIQANSPCTPFTWMPTRSISMR